MFIYQSTIDLESKYSSWPSSQMAAWANHHLCQKVKALVTKFMETWTEINKNILGYEQEVLSLTFHCTS